MLLLICARKVPGSLGAASRTPVDIAGASFATIGLAGVVFALIEVPVRGSASFGVLGAAGIGALAFGAHSTTR